MTAYHRWLIKRRIYCEKCTEPVHATHVIRDYKGRDSVRCDYHSGLSRVPDSVGNVNWQYQPKTNLPGQWKRNIQPKETRT